MQQLLRLPLGFLLCSGTLLAVGLVYAWRGSTIFSPGALHEGRSPQEFAAKLELGGVSSHAQLSKNCAACHAPAWSNERMETRCLDCHQQIQRDIRKQVSLHGKISSAGECLRCHTEHLGPHATLTDFTQFDHGCTAFALTGKHAGLACAKCHTPQQYKLAAKSCVDCHAEPKVHLHKFGTNCRQCHSTETWKAPQLDQKLLVGFDHDKTKFPLTGGHTKVACVSCHKTSQFAGTATSCVSCHADPPVHRGKFGTDCKSCHSTQTWRSATFANHRFPLNHGGGGKQNKACSVCHQDASDYRQYTCYSCHKHEPEKTAHKHRKLQLTETELAACAKCHPTGRESREKRPKLSSLLDELELLLIVNSNAACPGLELNPPPEF